MNPALTHPATADSSNQDVPETIHTVYTVTTNPPTLLMAHPAAMPGSPLVIDNGGTTTTCYSKTRSKSWIKRSRCRECIGCLQKYHCGSCAGCKDNLKFGGSGKRHQTCIYRECQKLKYTPKDPFVYAKIGRYRECQKLKYTPKDPFVYAKIANTKLPRVRCGKCIGCLRTEDCGQCPSCRNKKKFGGTGKRYHRCLYRECQKLKYQPRNDTTAAAPAPEASRGNPAKRKRLDNEDNTEPELSYSAGDLPPTTIKNEVLSDSESSFSDNNEELVELAYTAELQSKDDKYKRVPDLELGDSEPDLDQELCDEDLIDVTDYLLTMDSNTHLEIYHLALVLGLSQSRVKGMMESPTFLDDVIAAWLRREDQVPKRGVPTWENLVKALRHPRLKQNEIADKIANEKIIHP